MTPGHGNKNDSGTDEDEEQSMQHFYIGYVPKEIAFHLSVIIENNAIYSFENLAYSVVGK